ncbi:polymorphic toxin-type HINT domain-containing protein [Deinococcus fonticola]|uniref:polymorphic toxin-type HINT domain-containing protein n=1 Tax=Deinococcus fonticola TaxID=2528713 RepID=UPI00197AC958|nr:polymorphic toxin-type HINT domain-containing protein [Deinococcus fonticola]
MFIPILWNQHREEYVAAINKAWEDGHISAGERFQLGAMGGALIADATPVVHSVMKVGRQVVDGTATWVKGLMGGSKSVVKAADEAMTVAATAGKLPEEAIKTIPPKLGENTTKLLNECNSQICFDAFDDLSDTIKASGRTEEEARLMADKAVKEVEDWTAANGYNHLPNEKMNNAELLVACKYLPNSFSPDTLVKTIAGLQRIDQIKVGRRVLAFNEQLKEEGYYPVTAVHQNYDPEVTVLSLVTSGGQREEITTTPRHLFYTTSGKWIEAGKLSNSDQLQRDGKAAGQVVNVTTSTRTAQMFNLTVEQAHTFFVGVNSWLVHNESLSACADLARPRAYGSITQVDAPIAVNAGTDLAYKARTVKQTFDGATVPYTVQDAASIVARQARDRWATLVLENSKSAKPLTEAQLRTEFQRRAYGIVADTKTGKEVNSVSGERMDYKASQYETNESAYADVLAQNREYKSSGAGNCSEARGCSILIGNSAEKFNAQDYFTYSFNVRFVEQNGQTVLKVLPKKRCDICKTTNYRFAPTDEYQDLIEFLFHF